MRGNSAPSRPYASREMTALGIDVGGMGTKIALLRPSGRVVRWARIPTEAERGWENLAERVVHRVRKWAFAAAGVGVPGPLSEDREVIECAVNLPGWVRVPFRRVLQRLLQIPVIVENDGNVAALAEHFLGAAKGAGSSVTFVLGTGVGGGIVLNGNLWLGDGGAGAELGHIPVERRGRVCSCGNRGCLEAYASGTAIARIAGVKTARDAFRSRSPRARRAIREAASALGTAIAGIASILNPRVVVVGGGVSLAGEGFLSLVRKEVKARVFPFIFRSMEIRRARLGSRAGAIGAALWARDRLLGRGGETLAQG